MAENGSVRQLRSLPSRGFAVHVAMTIGQFLDRAALIYPDRVAFIDEPGVQGNLGTLTYAEMKHRSDGLAATLASQGIGEGERVAIISANSAKFLICSAMFASTSSICMHVSSWSWPKRRMTTRSSSWRGQGARST